MEEETAFQPPLRRRAARLLMYGAGGVSALTVFASAVRFVFSHEAPLPLDPEIGRLLHQVLLQTPLALGVLTAFGLMTLLLMIAQFALSVYDDGATKRLARKEQAENIRHVHELHKAEEARAALEIAKSVSAGSSGPMPSAVSTSTEQLSGFLSDLQAFLADYARRADYRAAASSQGNLFELNSYRPKNNGA